jgi:hypothetical protein
MLRGRGVGCCWAAAVAGAASTQAQANTAPMCRAGRVIDCFNRQGTPEVAGGMSGTL